jgi:hypothetical protein
MVFFRLQASDSTDAISMMPANDQVCRRSGWPRQADRSTRSGIAPTQWPGAVDHLAAEHQVDFFNLDLAGILSFTVSPLELMLRGTLMYWFLFIVFRFILRRDVGALGISDFLFVVILGDASQNGMIGSATSASDAMVLIATLVFWSYMLDFMSFRFPLIQRFTAAQRLCLVRDGKLQRRNMRREFITDEELNAKIRHEGVEDIASVKRMYLEADGEMSLIRNDGPKAAT